MNKQIIIVVVVLTVIIGAFLLMRSNGGFQNLLQSSPQEVEDSMTPVVEQSSTETSSSESAEQTSAQSEVKEFTISNSGFKFNPATITVNEGDKVKITFKNTGGSHDIVIDEFNARTEVIQSGQEDSFEFTADKAGSYEFYCSVGNHRAMGMKGTLVVQ